MLTLLRKVNKLRSLTLMRAQYEQLDYVFVISFCDLNGFIS